MKFLFILSIVLGTCLPAYGWRRRALTPAREGRHLADLRLPPNLRSRDVPKFKIPNSELCAQLNLDPGQLYLVLPWWYQYCQDHKERKAKKSSAILPNLEYYMDRLKRVNYAKRMAKKQMVAINLHIALVSSRKHESDSDESIENLLYYKDCNHKPKESSPAPNLRSDIQPTPVRKPDPCPFPKMCCSMSCGDDCGSQQSYLSRQMEPLQQNLQPIQPISRQSSLPAQPQIMRGRKKKIKPSMDGMDLQLPFGARKSLGFTKEKIKSLISQDADIRKILKDLVRVTMQKVDLLEMVNARRSKAGRNSDTSWNSDDYDSYRQVE